MIPRAHTARLGPIDRTRHRPADPKALVEHHRRSYVDHGTPVETACDESGSSVPVVPSTGTATHPPANRATTTTPCAPAAHSTHCSPAIVRAAAHRDGDVAVPHDHHPSRTETRIGKFQQVAPGLSPVDSGAGFLAGIVRRTAEEELHGRRDDEVVALLRPYVFGGLVRPRSPIDDLFRTTLK